MRFSDTTKVASVLLAGVMLSACGSDPNRPATADQQRAAMHHAPPSADELKQAMSKVHFKTPDSNSAQTPPAGAGLPGTKSGQ
jgi:hypothetical protein